MTTQTNPTAPTTIAEALARAQAEFIDPPRASFNPHFRSRYADLCTVLQSVRPILARHGIAIVQATEPTDAGLYVRTRLLWRDQEISGLYPVIAAQNNAQGTGAGLTYARRYALAALVGVASDEDLDGQEATEKPRAASKAAKEQPVQPSTAAAAAMIERIRGIDDLEELIALKEEVGAAGPAAMHAWVARGKHLREKAGAK